MRLSVSHTTSYRFDPPMRGVVQSLRARPSEFEGQKVIDWSVAVDRSVKGACFRDGAGDWIETVTLIGAVSEVHVAISGTVETTDTAGVIRGFKEYVPPTAYQRPTQTTRLNTSLRALATEALGPDPASATPLDNAHKLAAAVAEAVAYTPGETHAHTTAAEALELGVGVCQDHAHVLIAAARAADIPARYVVGYLHSNDDGMAHEASHAWAELFVTGLGWVGFDPSNRCCPDERYIRIGSGFDAQDAALIRGVSQGHGAEEMSIDVAVQQVAQ